MQLYFILSLIASILVVIFAVTNAASVPVRIFFVNINLSLALIIFISTAFGAVIAALMGFVKQFKLKKQIKKLSSENQMLVLENKKLKEEIPFSKIPQSHTQSPDEENQIVDSKNI